MSVSRSRRQNSAVSSGPLNIFQLPAISTGRAYSSTRDRGDAGELASFEQLERGAAAGRDPRDAFGDAGFVDGPDGVPAADDGVAVAVGERAGDRERPFCEARPFEHPHRPVPEHRARAGDAPGELLARPRADV